MTDSVPEERPIKVTVTDPETGEVLGEQVIENDYMVICAGRCDLDGIQTYGNGTHVLTVRGVHRRDLFRTRRTPQGRVQPRLLR